MAVVLSILIPLLLSSPEVGTPAQTWAEVQSAGGRYLWAEGWGGSVEDADREALSALAGKISLTIVSSFRSVEGKSTRGNDTVGYADVESSLRTFSSVSLSGTGVEVLERGRKCHVVRWISRDELARMRERRTAQVNEYITAAEMCEKEERISDAVKNYYWAYALVRACPELALSTLADGMQLAEWLPSRINGLLSGFRVRIVSMKAEQAVLEFTYGGKKTAGTEFRFFDGSRWSDTVTAFDGTATVRLHYNTSPEYLHVKYEYSFSDEVRPGSELFLALEYISDEPMRKAYSAVPCCYQEKSCSQVINLERPLSEVWH